MGTKKEQEAWGIDTPGKLCSVVSVQMSRIRTERLAAETGVGSSLQRES